MRSRHPKPKTETLRANTTAKKVSRKKAPTGKLTATAPSREKVRAHRERMRKKGMKLIQIWVPDPRSPHFATQAHRDSLAAAGSPGEREAQAFLDSVSWWNSEEAQALESDDPTPWWRTSDGRSG